MTAALKPRAVLEQAIEALIAVLDTIEPDPDLEPAGDEEDGHADDMEPSLGAMGSYVNGRLEYDLEADRCDDEPWLAGFSGGDDDREPDGDEGDYSGGESDPPGLIPGGQGA